MLLSSPCHAPPSRCAMTCDGHVDCVDSSKRSRSIRGTRGTGYRMFSRWECALDYKKLIKAHGYRGARPDRGKASKLLRSNEILMSSAGRGVPAKADLLFLGIALCGPTALSDRPCLCRFCEIGPGFVSNSRGPSEHIRRELALSFEVSTELATAGRTPESSDASIRSAATISADPNHGAIHAEPFARQEPPRWRTASWLVWPFSASLGFCAATAWTG